VNPKPRGARLCPNSNKRGVRSAGAHERRYPRGQAKRAACAAATPKHCPGSLPAGSSAPASRPADEVPPWRRGQAAALKALGWAKPQVKLVRARAKPSAGRPAPPREPRGPRAISKARSDSRPRERHRRGLPPVSKKFPLPKHPRFRRSVARGDSSSPGEAAAEESRRRAAGRKRRRSPSRRNSPSRSSTKSSLSIVCPPNFLKVHQLASERLGGKKKRPLRSPSRPPIQLKKLKPLPLPPPPPVEGAASNRLREGPPGTPQPRGHDHFHFLKTSCSERATLKVHCRVLGGLASIG
jgi:hypothetical protein